MKLDFNTLILFIISIGVGSALIFYISKARHKNLYINKKQGVLITQKRDLIEMRFLNSPQLVQSSFNKKTPLKIMLNYQKMIISCLLCLPKPPAKIAIVGLGGGNLTRHIRRLYPECVIEHYEINERMLDYAQRYFRFIPDEKMKFFFGDAIVLLQAQHFLSESERYDLIILDAFEADKPLPYFFSLSFSRHLKNLLSANGVLLFNLVGFDMASQVSRHIYHNVFSHVAICHSGQYLEKNYICWGSEQLPQKPAIADYAHLLKLQNINEDFINNIFFNISKNIAKY